MVEAMVGGSVHLQLLCLAGIPHQAPPNHLLLIGRVSDWKDVDAALVERSEGFVPGPAMVIFQLHDARLWLRGPSRAAMTTICFVHEILLHPEI